MKKILIILFLCLLLPTIATADGLIIKTAGGGGGDSCTGGLLFSWHCESTTVTSGTPQGCSLGDDLATGYSAAAINSDVVQDGTYSCDFPTSGDYYGFTVSNRDIADERAGTAIFYLYLNTFVANTWVFNLQYNEDTDRILVYQEAGTYNRLKLLYEGQNSLITAFTANTSNIPTGQWLKVTAKWSYAAVGGLHLSISYNDANTGTSSSALNTMTGTPTTLHIGNAKTYSGDFAIDNIKIYNSWL